jgi:hypothetical protein
MVSVDSEHLQALADAAPPEGSENDQAILNSCAGLFFFGVPNRGLDIKNIRTLVKDQRNEHFIDDLREGSALLKHAHRHFLRGFQLNDCQITSFYETRDTRAVVVCLLHTVYYLLIGHALTLLMLKVREDGNWNRSGEMVRIVTEESATWALPTEANYGRIPIDANHSDMVKFTDRNDRHYMTVLERLHGCVGKARGVIENRLAKGGKEGEEECM